MSPRLPPWFDAGDHTRLLAPIVESEFERLTLAGRLLLTTAGTWLSLRRQARSVVHEHLQTEGLASIARHWEGSFDLLAELRRGLEEGGEPVDPSQALALAQARHELHAVRTVLVHAVMAVPSLAEATLDKAEVLSRSLDRLLSDFDEGIDPWLPALRRAARLPSDDADVQRWRAELLDANSAPANPWWIDLVDADLVVRPLVAPPVVGLAGTLEPGRTMATWRFERGLVVVLFVDARGDLLVSLDRMPPGFDPDGLSLEWIHDQRTHVVPLAIDELDEWTARPATSLLASEIVSLRQGEQYFVQLEG